ncbi:glucosamine-6-phosphate deaminase [Salisediminibacterium selenitireducens]|uniref:Glucosamine-6-phosphate deaminase n=1 Tax=Bacillus selenitireducens (strain ATCC 700615 / DSM 15326 / MLS10) TaxID=439292 RepID=D6XVV3_BACIE|nr:glucosamine-6-phosphate deaminase [Salisediminibacterium selenitireducens]ADH97726.1 glucosamine-6-phosphate isomerase [[Bacillus] selenitireducens MLS10]
MTITIQTVDDYHAMSEQAAEYFYDAIKENPDIHIGLATGGTPSGMYEALIQKIQDSALPLGAIQTFNLDEYIGLSQDDPNSYYTFMKDTLFAPLKLSRNQTYVPDGNTSDHEMECRRYEALIDEHGIDLQLLGVGENGHIGFNEPGTPFDSVTHVIELNDTTREANARYFNSPDEVPTHAITMGIRSILKAKKIVLLASGTNKAEAISALFRDTITEDWPITALKEHPDVTVIVDKAAAGQIPDEK